MTQTCDVMQISVDELLESGRTRRAPSLLVPMFMIGLIVAVGISMAGDSPWLKPLVPLLFLGLIGASIWNASRVARDQRLEQDLVRQADESLRLNRWDAATSALGRLLGGPSPRPQVRLQALIYLTGAWVRAGRFSDVIRLCDYLLDQAVFPPPITLSLRCVRAYAMLRDDRLSDSYEAIAQLRREFSAGSGMMSVLEMYRLVKTGHYVDVLTMLESRKSIIAAQLGHRSSDAWALAAAAQLALGNREEATTLARRACVLSDSAEIVRRFPECRQAIELVMGGSDAR